MVRVDLTHQLLRDLGAILLLVFCVFLFSAQCFTSFHFSQDVHRFLARMCIMHLACNMYNMYKCMITNQVLVVKILVLLLNFHPIRTKPTNLTE